MMIRYDLAFCAALLAATLATHAIAQTDDLPATRPVAAGSAPHHAAAAPRRRKAPAASPAPEAYQLVPPSKPTSAQTRARQNAFGTPDDDPTPSDSGSRRLGIGLGGAGGTTPGMAIGF